MNFKDKLITQKNVLILFRAGTVFFVFIVMLLQSCHTRKKEESKQNIESITSDLLLYIPPVVSVYVNDDTATSIILTTADVARFDGKTGEKSYSNSLQIIDANEPWPPRWYVCPPYYTDEMYLSIIDRKQYRYDLTIDAKIESGFLSFYKILSQQDIGVGQLVAPEFAGYILLNENYESVDTVTNREVGMNMYFRDLRINANGERMVDMKKNIQLDLRRYTGNQKDSSLNCHVDYIHILDTNNNVLFSWDPLKHLDPLVFKFKETLASRAFASRHADIVEWTRLTSALWDYDGNILFAMKKIGIGKISRKDGHVMWLIKNSDLPIVTGNDTLLWFEPHDFNLLSETSQTVTYSLYSNGSETHSACGVIFEMEKETRKLKLVKYIPTKTNYVADGQGNLEYHTDGDYAIGYGFFEKSDTVAGYRNVLDYQKANGQYGVYQLPQWVYTYKARLVKNWPRPPRPVITIEGSQLRVSGEMEDWTWYKLSGPQNRTIEKAGKGETIKPEKGSVYCVEGKYGIGFSVSRVFRL